MWTLNMYSTSSDGLRSRLNSTPLFQGQMDPTEPLRERQTRSPKIKNVRSLSAEPETSSSCSLKSNGYYSTAKVDLVNTPFNVFGPRIDASSAVEVEMSHSQTMTQASAALSSGIALKIQNFVGIEGNLKTGVKVQLLDSQLEMGVTSELAYKATIQGSIFGAVTQNQYTSPIKGFATEQKTSCSVGGRVQVSWHSQSIPKKTAILSCLNFAQAAGQCVGAALGSQVLEMATGSAIGGLVGGGLATKMLMKIPGLKPDSVMTTGICEETQSALLNTEAYFLVMPDLNVKASFSAGTMNKREACLYSTLPVTEKTNEKSRAAKDAYEMDVETEQEVESEIESDLEDENIERGYETGDI